MVRYKRHQLCDECRCSHSEHSELTGCTGDDSLLIAGVFGFVFVFILFAFIAAAPDSRCGCTLSNGIYYCPTTST